MQGVRYIPYKHNSVMTAIREGEVQKVRELIRSRGLSYSQEWSDASSGYAFLCAAMEEQHTEITKLLLTNGSKVNNENSSSSNTPLHFAVINGDIEIVQMLLDRGANINAENLDGKTALHNAVGSMNIKIIGMLLSQAANIDAADKSGLTPLHLAIGNNSKEITNLLLSKGANVEGKISGPSAADKRDACTPLHFAVEKGNEEITELLLSSGANVDAKGNNGVTPLHIAAEKGDLQIVEQLLKHGADVNSAYTSTYLEGYTPLHFAVENGSKDIITLLLSKGANANAAGRHGVTPLHIATEGGHPQIVEQLLKHGANVYSESGKGHTPVYLAVKKQHEKVVKLLLEYGAYVDPVDESDKTMLHFVVEKGWSIIVEYILKHCTDLNNPSNSSVLNAAVQGCGIEYNMIVKNLLQYGFKVNPKDANNFMHAAVKKGYLELVEELLKHGTDVNLLCGLTSTKGSIPLHVATKYGHEEVAKLLISYGAYINAQDEAGKTPIFYATESADLSMTKLLLNNKANVKDNPELLNIAVKEDHKEIVEVLLEYGADVNASDEHGRTPLHFIILDGEGKSSKFHHRRNPSVKGAVARLLLSRGADANVRIKSSMTMLHAATNNNYLEVIEALLEYNADVNSTYGKGTTPLHLSARHGNKVITEMLLKNGANINAEDLDEATALHFATKNGHEEVVELLLKRGAKVNAASKFDLETPLHVAAESGYLKIAKHLLEFGAKVDSTLESFKLTPLHKAALNGHVEIVYLLLEFGASVDTTDVYGTTALHCACRRGHKQVIEALLDHGSDITIKNDNNGTAHQFAKDFDGLLSVDNDDYDTDYDFSANVNVARILERHMVKLKAANLYSGPSLVINKYIVAVLACSEISCKEEIARMKSEKFVNTDITFYDILTKDTSQLATYARNENIKWIFESPHYKTYFPIYAGMITSNFRKGERKRDSVEQGKKIFGVLFNNPPGLPCGCVERILSYLNGENIRTLMDAVSL